MPSGAAECLCDVQGPKSKSEIPAAPGVQGRKREGAANRDEMNVGSSGLLQFDEAHGGPDAFGRLAPARLRTLSPVPARRERPASNTKIKPLGATDRRALTYPLPPLPTGEGERRLRGERGTLGTTMSVEAELRDWPGSEEDRACVFDHVLFFATPDSGRIQKRVWTGWQAGLATTIEKTRGSRVMSRIYRCRSSGTGLRSAS